ncbi:unnamed protein product [Nesidiocoris tenuis]|uniref:ABC transporter domain-containing protein n=1 Tax=Nesidiocoris tenuis TaxID=355587 RepID=A0A6H5HPG6_9HEMI|nr:unnamed protein product [Nesidiocoris tenuis]
MDKTEYEPLNVNVEERADAGTPSPSPSRGLTLSWHKLSVWVKKKDEEKSTWFTKRTTDTKILSKVSGVAEPGSIMAILGPSGAGKTTLLATVSQRLKGNVKGDILVNGKQISKELMLKVSGFVPQKDLCIESLTVWEHLQFMAILKMDRQTSKSSRSQRILALVSELGIVDCKNKRISILSGGERKRLSVAVQLLTDPALLFCDEPTTGLDSYSAMSVVEQLRRLAGNGKSIICTIHQPASGLLDMFDSVYLLVAGGRMALYTSTNEALAYFNRIGIVCPPTYNLAEFLVSQLAIEDDPESIKRVNNIVKIYKKSTEYEALQKRLENEVINGQFTILNDSSTKMSDSICQFLALLISVPYVALEVDQEGIQNLQGFLYLVIVETIFTFEYSVTHTFPAEIPILLREVDNGLYTPAAYYISKMIALLPRSLIEPMIYTLLTFNIPGLSGGLLGYLKFSIPVTAAAITATAYGCLISAYFESISSASMISVPFEQICLLFCGIYMALNDVPFHFAWVKYISIFYYGLEAVSILQWTQITDIPCSDKKGAPCIRTGEGVLENYGYNKDHFNLDMVGLGLLYVVCHSLGYLAFWRRSKAQAAY